MEILQTIDIIMNTALARYVTEFIEEMGWSARELARRIGVSHSTVSEVMNETRSPTADFCVALSRVTPESEIELLRMAGIIPLAPPEIVEEEEIISILRGLAQRRPAEYTFLLRIIRSFVSEKTQPIRKEDGPETRTEQLALEALRQLHTMSPAIYNNAIQMIVSLAGGTSPTFLMLEQRLAEMDLLSIVEAEYPDAPPCAQQLIIDELRAKARKIAQRLREGTEEGGESSHCNQEGG